MPSIRKPSMWDEADSDKVAHMLRRRSPAEVARYMGVDEALVRHIAVSGRRSRNLTGYGTIQREPLDDSKKDLKSDLAAERGSAALRDSIMALHKKGYPIV